MKWTARGAKVMGVFIGKGLTATLTASAFALIGPAACHTGVHTMAESVHQNCVLGRCAYLCSIIVLHLPSLFFFFEILLQANFKLIK